MLISIFIMSQGGTDTDLIIASKYGNLNEVTQLLEATPRAVHDIGQVRPKALCALKLLF